MATPVELGLGLPRRAPSAARIEDGPLVARYLAVALRRPTVMLLHEEWVATAPDGSEHRGRDPVAAARDAAALPLPPRVAVFGGAWTAEDHPEYADVVGLGERLADAGRHVVCGGYQGVMAAVCRGAHGRGGVTVGVTVLPWSDRVPVNPWLTHEVVARDLFARLPLIADADAWVAFPGGVGTLGEVALCWNLVQTGLAAPRPLVVVGEPWSRQMELFRELLRVSDPAHFDLVRPAADTGEAAELLGIG